MDDATANLLPGTLDLLVLEASLTRAGRRRLGEETARWKRLVEAMSLTLSATAREV